jgi:hypothetical protein
LNRGQSFVNDFDELIKPAIHYVFYFHRLSHHQLLMQFPRQFFFNPILLNFCSNTKFISYLSIRAQVHRHRQPFTNAEKNNSDEKGNVAFFQS